MTKTWSYAFANSKLRKVSRQKNHKDNSNLLEYPNNVTIKNLFTYFIFTPPIQYQPCLHSKINPNWIAIIKYAVKQFLVLYVTLFIGIQYLYPELQTLRGTENGWIHDLRCGTNIALPVAICWIFYCYISTYRVYLPAYAEFTGMKNTVFSTDWWNSEDLNVFWRKWNIPVHECLKFNVVVPLMKNGYSKMFSIFVAYILAGILHEYLNSLPLGVYNGMHMFFTLLEIPAGYITTYIGEKFGKRIGNLTLWAYLIIFHTIGTLFYGYKLRDMSVFLEAVN
ncbi:hypothetical protein ILUMI_20257 [Ignelater luminosus]|uniref:Wax synthase domain-containing protein n=1 Tax=Ignelater luminosus TaxID=2038154 RepID=A0A8K0G4S2_IGNLU|nr:hypothetical protein ILUMI_20257 [Ignelater luminosus]